MRWLTTSDGLLITGSEAGMVVVPETTITAKGALGPGQMIAVDLDGEAGEGPRLYTDARSRTASPTPRPMPSGSSISAPSPTCPATTRPSRRAASTAPSCAAARSPPG